ncbi:MAG TPA: glycosyltransferase family 2 protein [Thermoanaerobaculia bacterium]|nr:glycosyltransferase family 2 protein [Thermoanaerobaculia bacterium]
MLHVLLGACALYGAFCLILFGVNYLTIPRLSRERAAGPGAPLLSIVVPARNEERAIGRGVSSLLAQTYPRLEVIVVDDRSTDRTGEILRGLPSDARLRIVVGEDPPAGWLGKPHALFQGAAVARGELLLFVDADVRYHPEAASQAVGFLERRRADFVGLLPKLEAETFWEEVLMPNLLCAVYFGPGFLANFDRPRSIAGGSGAGNLVRRSVYDAIGGHASLRASVIDDLHLAVAAKRPGFRARVVAAQDRVAVRMYNGFREVWDGFTKNVAFSVSGVLGIAVLLLLLLSTGAALLPLAVLVAALFGAPISSTDVVLAVAAIAYVVLARTLLALSQGNSVWPAVTHPLMAAVWAALLARSLYQRYVRRSIVWRGRAFDARKAGF